MSTSIFAVKDPAGKIIERTKKPAHRKASKAAASDICGKPWKTLFAEGFRCVAMAVGK